MLNFSKMHSLGNDFMVIDGVTTSVELDPEQVAAWGTASAVLVLTSYSSWSLQARQTVTLTMSSLTPTVAKRSNVATARAVSRICSPSWVESTKSALLAFKGRHNSHKQAT